MNNKYLSTLTTLFLGLGYSYSVFCSTPQTNTSSYSDHFSFALIGDLPYGVNVGQASLETKKLIKNLNQVDELAWVLHVGDIKNGTNTCSDSLLKDRKRRFDKIKHPFIYTPGDNEWTDCHRITSGAYDPLDRLKNLRSIFFADDKAEKTRNTLSITQQSAEQKQHAEFIENYFWFYKGVAFTTIHIVGSKNGKEPFSTFAKTKRSERHEKEVQRRESAALDWLSYAFDEAKKRKAKGLFISIHANPGLDRNADKETKKAFSFFNSALEKHLRNIKLPTVLAHGDSHYFRIDKPRLSKRKPPPHFVRLESFGENNDAWIKVSVTPDAPNVFSFSIFDGL